MEFYFAANDHYPKWYDEDFWDAVCYAVTSISNLGMTKDEAYRVLMEKYANMEDYFASYGYYPEGYGKDFLEAVYCIAKSL